MAPLAVALLRIENLAFHWGSKVRVKRKEWINNDVCQALKFSIKKTIKIIIFTPYHCPQSILVLIKIIILA